jgi:hypothetical protein
MKLPSIQQLVQDSSRTFLRFPLVIIAAAAGTVCALILVDYEGPHAATVVFKILWASVLGIPLLTGVRLVAGKNKWAGMARFVSDSIALILLIGYAFSVPSDLADAPGIHLIRLLVLAIACHFFVAFAPFAGGSNVDGFWQYNKTLFYRILSAILFSIVLYAGFSLALAALDHLFGMNIPGKRYLELWILINGMFTTWFFLAGIPLDLDGLDALTDYPKGIRIFAQHILFPLVIVYVVILYAYLAKILIAWDWPQGWVSKLILGFSATGILSLLLLHPIRDRAENVWIGKVSRWFYVVLIPLVVMLFFAVWRRISEYGTTEGRYIAMALGVWLAAMAAYFILSRTKNIRAIPASLCVFSLLVSYGPWGMFEVSEKSQVERLRGLLTRNSILVDGTVRKAESAVSYEATKQICSILTYLHDIHGYDRIQPWFHESIMNEPASGLSRAKGPELVTKMMGIEYVAVWQSSAADWFSLSAKYNAAIDVEGYDRMLAAQHFNTSDMKKVFSDESIACRLNSGLDTMTFLATRDGKPVDSLLIDVRQLLDKLMKDYGNTNAGNIPPDKMSASNAKGEMKVKVYFRRIDGRRRDNRVILNSYEADILYSTTKPKE